MKYTTDKLSEVNVAGEKLLRKVHLGRILENGY